MASFFEQQAQARKMTTRLLVLFTMAVLSIVATITFIVHVGFSTQRSDRYTKKYDAYEAETPDYQADAIVALGTLAVIGIGTLVRMAQIGGNGTNVALMLGGVPVSQATTDPGERRLMNVVEEMSIASSVPVPKVFVLRDEGGINAFAAGLEPSQAVIGVTRGTIESLTRDELQGVVAHEFSHIFNGDMKLNLRLIGVLGGILALATIGRHMMRARGKNSGGIVMAGLALFMVGWIGVFFGRLIKAAVSRQREFLADSSAVQYTRNPLGIGGALMKIQNSFSNVSNSYADEASHMFFGSVMNFSSLFATHPPLPERISRISPTLLQKGAWVSRKPLSEEDEAAEALVSQLRAPATAPARPVEAIVASVGAPEAGDLAAARRLIHSLPSELREELHSVGGAREILCALLFEPNGGSTKQHALVREALGETGLAKARHLYGIIGDGARNHRLSILQLALPSFRTLDPIQQRSFLVVARELVFADQKFDLFEYVALTIVESQLEGRKRRARDSKPTKRDLSLVLSALAYAGSPDVAKAKTAFDTGLVAFDAKLRPGIEFCPPDHCKYELLSPSVWRLAHAFPETKRSFIEASTRVIMADGTLSAEENELLHAVCAVLEAPLPVMAAG